MADVRLWRSFRLSTLLLLFTFQICVNGNSDGLCDGGYASDDEGIKYQCSNIDLLTRIPLNEYYPTNISEIGEEYHRFEDTAKDLCVECKKKNSTMYGDTLTLSGLSDKCIDIVKGLEDKTTNPPGICTPTFTETGLAPNICYDCESIIYATIGRLNPGDIPKVDHKCMTSFFWLCDTEPGQSDIWGWTNPSTGNNYILAGLRHGVSILRVSATEKPRVVAFVKHPSVPGHFRLHRQESYAAPSWWKDIKVLDNRYMLIASEAANYGIQAYDLYDVAEIDKENIEPIPDLKAVSSYRGVSSTHNMVISGAGPYVYALGTNTCRGGFHMISYKDPLRPKYIDCYENEGYIHDCECDRYHGKDNRFSGKEICFCGAPNCNYDQGGLGVFDMENKEDIKLLACVPYDEQGYPHQGWLDDNHDFFFFGDEQDEQRYNLNTTTIIWNISNLTNPSIVTKWSNPSTKSIDHNMFYHRGVIFQANYESGLRILKFHPNSPTPQGFLEEIGLFDVHPQPTRVTYFNGSWAVWPFFDNSIIVAAGEKTGIFVLRMKEKLYNKLDPLLQPTTAVTPSASSRILIITMIIIVALALLVSIAAYRQICKNRPSEYSNPDIPLDALDDEEEFESHQERSNTQGEDLGFIIAHAVGPGDPEDEYEQ